MTLIKNSRTCRNLSTQTPLLPLSADPDQSLVLTKTEHLQVRLYQPSLDVTGTTDTNRCLNPKTPYQQHTVEKEQIKGLSTTTHRSDKQRGKEVNNEKKRQDFKKEIEEAVQRYSAKSKQQK